MLKCPDWKTLDPLLASRVTSGQSCLIKLTSSQIASQEKAPYLPRFRCPIHSGATLQEIALQLSRPAAPANQ